MNLRKNLLSLAKQFKTDKFEHGYLPYYVKHLPDKLDDILEIGCYQGESLRLWKYLFPEAKISTIDLFGDPNGISFEAIQDEGFIAYVGNQADPYFLLSITDKFDLIIDDGSHNSIDQLLSFKHLFQLNLKSEGIYVCEDLHCCKESYFWGPVKKFEDTFLYMMQFWNKNKIFPENILFDKTETIIFKQLIKQIDLYNDKIAFIKKVEIC